MVDTVTLTLDWSWDLSVCLLSDRPTAEETTFYSRFIVIVRKHWANKHISKQLKV